MSKVVFDSSALLAFLSEEPGASVVEPYLGRAYLSSVNLAEVLSVLSLTGWSVKDAKQLVMPLIQVVHFDDEQAAFTANLRALSKPYGLSLGDRACLALADKLKVPVLTADKIWQKLDLSLEIRLIR